MTMQNNQDTGTEMTREKWRERRAQKKAAAESRGLWNRNGCFV